jgi:hypothetical protein
MTVDLGYHRQNRYRARRCRSLLKNRRFYDLHFQQLKESYSYVIDLLILLKTVAVYGLSPWPIEDCFSASKSFNLSSNTLVDT